jgi:hypothetical protein
MVHFDNNDVFDEALTSGRMVDTSVDGLFVRDGRVSSAQ